MADSIKEEWFHIIPAISLTLLCRLILSKGAPIFSFKWQYAQFLLLNNFSPCTGLPGYIRFLFFFPCVLMDSRYAARLANSFPLKTGIVIFDVSWFLFFFPCVLMDSRYAARLANSFPLKTGIVIFDVSCFLCICEIGRAHV